MTTLTAKKNGLGTKKDLKTKGTPIAKMVETKKENETKTTVSSEKPQTKENTPKSNVIDKITSREVNTEVKKEVKPELTLEQRIEKVENLKILIEKREILEESRKKLNAFVVGSPQFGENIKLTDENGNNFQTSNTEVFTKVIDTIKTTLVEKIKEIEQEIQF